MKLYFLLTLLVGVVLGTLATNIEIGCNQARAHTRLTCLYAIAVVIALIVATA